MAGRIQVKPTKLVSSPMYSRMLEAAHRQGKGDAKLLHEHVLIGIDPGETTGFAYQLPWEPQWTMHVAQLETKSIKQGMAALRDAWPDTKLPIIAVCEDYKVYAWKATDHSWNNLHTAKLIGAIEYQCIAMGVPLVYQMAGQAKAWATDEKLKLWGLYESGLKHGRDAVRHLTSYSFFGQRPTSEITEAEMNAAKWAKG